MTDFSAQIQKTVIATITKLPIIFVEDLNRGFLQSKGSASGPTQTTATENVQRLSMTLTFFPWGEPADAPGTPWVAALGPGEGGGLYGGGTD